MLPVLAIAAWLAIFGDKNPAGEEVVVSAVVTPRAGGVSAPLRVSPGAASGDVMAVAPPQVASVASAPLSSREGIVRALKEPSPKNLFAVTAGAAVAEISAPVQEEDRPPPPPRFVFIGSVVKDGRFNVFLDKDGHTYIATPGVVIDGNRVDVVKSDQVQLFNLSTKKIQIIPIEGDK